MDIDFSIIPVTIFLSCRLILIGWEKDAIYSKKQCGL